jgi:hypothetical protein
MYHCHILFREVVETIVISMSIGLMERPQRKRSRISTVLERLSSRGIWPNRIIIKILQERKAGIRMKSLSFLQPQLSLRRREAELQGISL